MANKGIQWFWKVQTQCDVTFTVRQFLEFVTPNHSMTADLQCACFRSVNQTVLATAAAQKPVLSDFSSEYISICQFKSQEIIFNQKK